MDTFTFDSVARLFGSGMTRREALRGLMAGAAAVTAGGALLAVEETAAAKNKRRKSRNKNKKKNRPAPQSDPTPEVNVCAGKNWCIDRTQTCGPAGGYGKCLVDATGGNICAELLFQVQSCTECEAPNCTNCRCVPAAGGGDRATTEPTATISSASARSETSRLRGPQRERAQCNDPDRLGGQGLGLVTTRSYASILIGLRRHV